MVLMEMFVMGGLGEEGGDVGKGRFGVRSWWMGMVER
jgi:hypothetical protein